MRDKGHCMMPYDKDGEFGIFYDFSRAYRELPQKAMITAGGEDSKSSTFSAVEERKIERNQRMVDGGNDKNYNDVIEANDSGSDDWEDVDCDDGESMEDVEEANECEEESSEQPSGTTESEESSSGFVNVTGGAGRAGESSASFSIIDSKAQTSSI